MFSSHLQGFESKRKRRLDQLHTQQTGTLLLYYMSRRFLPLGFGLQYWAWLLNGFHVLYWDLELSSSKVHQNSCPILYCYHFKFEAMHPHPRSGANLLVAVFSCLIYASSFPQYSLPCPLQLSDITQSLRACVTTSPPYSFLLGSAHATPFLSRGGPSGSAVIVSPSSRHAPPCQVQ